MHNRTGMITPLYGDYDWLINPVGQLVNIGEKGEITWRFCSGFNISNNGYFLTAGHCISTDNVCYTDGRSVSLYDTRVSFTYQCLPTADMRMCNVSTSEPTYVVNRIVGQGACHYTAQEKLDYAVLSLEPQASAHGYLPLSLESPQWGDEIACVQHPQGGVKKYSVGKITAVFDHLIDHEAHTYGGSSGAPVVSLTKKKAVAVHVAGTEFPNSGRIPDHKHHFAVPTKSILQNALAARENWPVTIGLFRLKTNPASAKGVIRLHESNVAGGKPGGCC